MFAWASLPPACSQSVYHMLFWLHHSNAPHAQTIEAFSLSKWGRGPQAEALPVARLTLPWPHPLAWYCSQYSKTCLKQPLKTDKTKILMINGSLMKVERIAEYSSWSILQYFWPALSDNWSSFLSDRLRQVLQYNQQSIYIYAYKCLCQCVGKVYYPNVNCD